MYQIDPTKPLGRRRSISAERQAEVFRQHYAAAKPNSVEAKPNSVIPKKRGRPRKADK